MTGQKKKFKYLLNFFFCPVIINYIYFSMYLSSVWWHYDGDFSILKEWHNLTQINFLFIFLKFFFSLKAGGLGLTVKFKVKMLLIKRNVPPCHLLSLPLSTHEKDRDSWQGNSVRHCVWTEVIRLQDSGWLISSTLCDTVSLRNNYLYCVPTHLVYLLLIIWNVKSSGVVFFLLLE